MIRTEILGQAAQIVAVDRAATHGDAEDVFGLISAYWSAHLDCPVTATDVGVMMALLKIARIRANPGHADNYIDLAGYAACTAELALTPAGAPDTPEDDGA